MKTALQRLWMTLLAVVSLTACGSPEPMTDDEATMWVAAYSSERIYNDAYMAFGMPHYTANADTYKEYLEILSKQIFS